MRRSGYSKAFTLVELLVATAVVAAILAIVFSIISQVSKAWSKSSDQIEAFQGARGAFDLMTQSLSQATLNPYLDYDDPANPQRYLRKSELKFLNSLAGTSPVPGTTGTGQAMFFQAPLAHTLSQAAYGGMDSLLNTCGFYVQFGDDLTRPPHAVAVGGSKYRYRLMQMLVPAEENKIYTSTGGTWISDHTDRVSPVADNVLALVIRLQDPGLADTDLPNSSYSYDSTLNANANPQPITANQLPPLAKITMVAIDETSAKRLFTGNTPPSQITAALANKFTDPAKYEQDLSQLTSALAVAKLQYRVFEGAVPIRESNWTK